MTTRRSSAETPAEGTVVRTDRAAHALSQVAFKLCAERDENALVHAALEDVVRALGIEGAVALFHDADGGERNLLRAGTMSVDDEQLRALAQDAIGARRAAFDMRASGWTSASPLVVRSGTVGALVLFDNGGRMPYEPSFFEALGRLFGAGIENARLSSELEASTARADVLSRITSTLGGSRELKDVIPAFASELRAFQPFDRLVCAFLNESRDYFDLLGFPEGATWGLGSVIPLVGSGPGAAVADNHPVLATDLLHSRRFIEDMRLLEEDLRSYLVVPLNARTQSIGSLCLAARKPSSFDAHAATRLQPVADALALAFENARLFLKTRELSITDDVTPLYNFRFFHQILDRELKFVDRYGSVVSLMFIDLDRFKPINDAYGHLRGSRVLREIGFLLRNAVRETDYPARYGGDEFCVILPRTSEDAARALAEKLREIIESHTFLQEEGINVRVGASVGVADYPTAANGKEALIRLADERMYADKERRKAGR